MLRNGTESVVYGKIVARRWSLGASAKRVAERRQRLASLSWFMSFRHASKFRAGAGSACGAAAGWAVLARSILESAAERAEGSSGASRRHGGAFGPWRVKVQQNGTPSCWHDVVLGHDSWRSGSARVSQARWRG